MRIGLLGPPGEPHCQSVKEALAALGAEGFLVDTSAFDAQRRFSFRGTDLAYGGESLAGVHAFYLRSLLSPVPEVYVEEGRYKLYADWHQSYMAAREQHGFLLAWLMALLDQGKAMVNPPHLGTISLLKPYQLFRLEQLGFPVPRTIVTNDPAEARAFVQGVGDAVCKPAIGGAFCEAVTDEVLARLQAITRSPVIFQERLMGPDIRVTAVPGRVLSAVEVESDQLDFRATAAYEAGEEVYTPVRLPEAVEAMCFAAMEASGLGFSGIDLKRVGPEAYVILELNFSPAFLAIELKTGHPVSEGLASYLLHCAERVAAQAGPVPDRDGPFFRFAAPEPSGPGA